MVDDSSTEQYSIDVFKRIAKENPSFTMMTVPDNGVAVARNRGVEIARGRYVVCLDSDDILEATYLEKLVTVLEANPQLDLVSTDMLMFGVNSGVYKQGDYDPARLISNNMLITAAMFRRTAWQDVGGYTPEIGYEDWEFWIKLAEAGHWGKRVPEPIFHYRTAASSRYIDDKSKHAHNVQTIKSLHPAYSVNIHKLQRQRRRLKYEVDPTDIFVNLNKPSQYAPVPKPKNPNVLIAVPWMTFGGAETLILNFTKEIKDKFNLSFVTGLASDHEWEFKFKEITQNIYHLTNLFGDDKRLFLEFISNYVASRDISILHIVHTDFVFELLPELKRRHPNLEVVVTMFNDRVEHFQKSVDTQKYIDRFTSDNSKVGKHYSDLLGSDERVTVIPNGIDCVNVFSPRLFNRNEERRKLGLAEDELAVTFVGRLSQEKNPDVFVGAAAGAIKQKANAKFFVVGDGPMGEQIGNQIKAVRSDKIVNLGYQQDVARYLSATDIFVLPSSVEGFPMSILEAMAMKIVVVASDVGAISDVLANGDDGIVITPGSVSEIVNSVVQLDKDRAKLDDMKAKAFQKLITTYSNKQLGDNYTKLYRDLLKWES